LNWPEEERRKEPRSPADGKVEFLLEDPLPRKFHGRLVDVSEGGFRASHEPTGLHAGVEVRFRHPAAEGRARVMWTRVLGERVESGFLIL